MRRYLLIVILIAGLLVSSTPVAADVDSIGPREEPPILLDEAEAEKLRLLQSARRPFPWSAVSPDDQSMVIQYSENQQAVVAFLNLNDGSLTPFQTDGTLPIPITALFSGAFELIWLDNTTIAYIGLSLPAPPGSDGLPAEDLFQPAAPPGGAGIALQYVTVDRRTGAISTVPLQLPGLPLSLAPDGNRVLLAINPNQAAPSGADYLVSPFDREIVQRMIPENVPAFGAFQDGAMQMSSNELTLVLYDIRAEQQTELITLPEGTGPRSWAWGPTGARLALVRYTIPQAAHIGHLLSDITTRDALGILPPADNPFLQGNRLDIFDFSGDEIGIRTLRAADAGIDVFAQVSWNSNGQTLLAQMQRPAQLEGREYPIYYRPESSYLRFYSPDGQLQSSFAAPEINAPNISIPQFVSPDEVLINAARGSSLALFYYNRVSGEFRRLPLPPGTAMMPQATNQSREVIFLYSSFDQPPDLFRINWDGSGFAGVTYFNAEIAAASEIRADRVDFTLANGARRSGYLVQPAAAPFPPQDVPIVVWQMGGPGSAMLNRWLGIVEHPYNLLPNFGMAVLVVPLPGREGFGPDFYNALADNRNFGQIDIDEQAEIVDQMIAQDWTSREQVGITGCSYGGYFTTQSLARHPLSYAAGHTQCSLLDLFQEWQFGYTPLMSYLMGVLPSIDSDEYARDSPYYNAERIQTPLLIYHGSNDFLPIQIVSNLYDQLAALYRPVEYDRFELAGHGLARPDYQFVAGQRQIRWFREHLGQ